MNPKTRVSRRSRRGIITILLVVLLAVVVGVAALAVDGGRLYAERQRVRAAADAAAMAAATELFDAAVREEPFAAGAAERSALEIARANGYENDGEQSRVEVNIPPRSGQYAHQDGYAEVIIESQLPRSFSRIFGLGATPVAGRSVAAGMLEPTKASVFVLDPKHKKTLELKKGGTVLETKGDVVVNTRDKNAANVDKGSRIIAENLLFSAHLEKKVAKRLQQYTRGEVHQQVAPAPDPLADLPVPQGGPARRLGDYRTVEDGKNVYHLQPGTYRDTLKFDRGDTVTMAPGSYVLEKGMSVKKGVVLDAQNVTLFLTKKPALKIESSSVTITPPSSGTYAGISIFADAAKKGKVEFKKDSNLDIQGIIYGPNAEVKFQDTDLTLDPGDMDDDYNYDDVDFAGDEAGDWEDDSWTGPEEEPSTFGRISASIICRKLKIEKGSYVLVQGNDIPSRRPALRIVE